MKIGIVPINIGAQAHPEKIADLAKAAEESGIESVWTFEHVIVPVAYASKYPYHPSGKMAAEPETPFIDPLIALTYAAAHTTRIKLATGVNILAQTNPLLLAKQAASLDNLCGGRLLLGLGVGWLEEEFRAMGTPFARRGARADDYITAMKEVWAGGVMDHKSDFLDWRGFKSYPLPVQKPHLPIVIGGISDAALRRAARFGDGWFAATTKPEDLAGMITTLRRYAEEAGRDPAAIEVSIFWAKAADGPEAAKPFRDLGVGRLIVPLHTLGDDPIDGVRKLGDAVVGKI